nr:fatty acid desaturase [Bacteroidia bacterium]
MQFISTDKKDILFFSTLRQRIDLYFKDNHLSKNYNAQMVVKTIVLLSAYILPFAALLIFQPPFAIAIIIWIIMGLAKSGIGMSIMHDANHGAYSSKAKINRWLGFTINLVGGVAFTWKLQHNIMHHTYTNIVHMDDDIEDKAIMRFSPHTKVLPVQKFQFIYAFLFYSILTLYWSFVKDFMNFYKYTKNGVNKASKAQNKFILGNIILCKVVYILVFFIIPLSILKIPVLT